METIQIFIADDHQLFIDGIKSLLKSEKEFIFMGEAHNGEEAFAILEKQIPDLLISDISMPGISGIELVKKVKLRWPDVKILVISMHAEKEIIAEIMLAEAEGYILKNASKNELIQAITEITSGGIYYARDVMNVAMQSIKKNTRAEQELQQLSQREMEILRLIAAEHSTKEIADALFISHRTVDSHRKSIMTKTQSKTIISLMKYVFRNGLLD